MSVFKRLSATIASRVNYLVGEIEDHDAVVECAIRDARKAVAKSRVRLTRLQADGVRLRRKLAGLKQDEKKWAERAISVADEDEEKAIMCLRKRQECQRQVTEITSAVEKYQGLEDRLGQDIRQAESRVTEMSQQRNLMLARQSAAQALNTMSGVDESMVNEVEGAFERWEMRITEEELETGNFDRDMDQSLEREFIDVEERAELRFQLKELLKEEENKNDRT
jgi:phage shock protein A